MNNIHDNIYEWAIIYFNKALGVGVQYYTIKRVCNASDMTTYCLAVCIWLSLSQVKILIFKG